MKTYTGIGSRQTPDDILRIMRCVGQDLGYLGWTLRSGCAEGADSAFEAGAWDARLRQGVPQPELYLPWPSFREGEREMISARSATLDQPQAEAFDIAAQFHPAWDGLKRGAKMLHARNVHQILGPDVTHPVLSRFVICWTPSGAGGGGTGQALRIAQHYDVPIFDLARADDLDRVMGLFAR